MQFDFWWLLVFPLFFGLGWLAARIDIKHVLSESRTLPQSYFKGLNFLLNEEPDKAIEAFNEVVSVETQTTELHFALGGLFRRRGEVERAIRMHQNLLERGVLDPAQRLAALFELAQDYLKAGLLDRAEQTFLELKNSSFGEPALKFLLEIYTLEREWDKAIGTAHSLAEVSNQSYAKEIAQFHCEMAAVAIIHGDVGEAQQRLNQALHISRRCVRANVMLGDVEAQSANHAEAVAIWKRVENQDPEYLPLVVQKMAASYSALQQIDEGLAQLRNYLGKYGSIEVLNVVFQATLEAQGPHEAYLLVRDELRRNPSLQGLDRLLEAQLLEASVDRRQDMQLIKTLVHQHSKRLSLFRCGNCGFRARQFYWQCPACKAWETIPPRKSEEEAAA